MMVLPARIFGQFAFEHRGGSKNGFPRAYLAKILRFGFFSRLPLPNCLQNRLERDTASLGVRLAIAILLLFLPLASPAPESRLESFLIDGRQTMRP